MIRRIRITAIMHDGRMTSRETTPIQIETAKGDLLKWMYEGMDLTERTRKQPEATTPTQAVCGCGRKIEDGYAIMCKRCQEHEAAQQKEAKDEHIQDGRTGSTRA